MTKEGTGFQECENQERVLQGDFWEISFIPNLIIQGNSHHFSLWLLRHTLFFCHKNGEK
jgi:hypothetical protein